VFNSSEAEAVQILFFLDAARFLKKKNYFCWKIPTFGPFVLYRYFEDDEYVALVLYTDRRKQKYSRQTPLCATSSITNHAWTGPESNMGSCGEAPSRCSLFPQHSKHSVLPLQIGTG
jgi:hypothetical protein